MGLDYRDAPFTKLYLIFPVIIDFLVSIIELLRNALQIVPGRINNAKFDFGRIILTCLI